MKSLVFTLILGLAFNSVISLPARDPKDDAEFVSVPKGQQNVHKDNTDSETDTDPDFKEFTGVIDTGSQYPFYSPLPAYDPSFSLRGSGFFDSFEDVFRRLRERVLNSWWNNVPKPGDADWDSNEGNSTSEVKVIDGHKVVVNDTVYTKKDDDGHAIFRVRIVNIHPVESSEEVEKTNGGSDTTTEQKNNDNGSPEVIEKQPKDNEISRNIDSSEHQDTTTPIIIDEHNTKAFNNNKDTVSIQNNFQKDVETIEINDAWTKGQSTEYKSNKQQKEYATNPLSLLSSKVSTSELLNRNEKQNEKEEIEEEIIDNLNDNIDESTNINREDIIINDNSKEKENYEQKEFEEFHIKNEPEFYKLQDSINYAIKNNEKFVPIDSHEENLNYNKYNSEWDDIYNEHIINNKNKDYTYIKNDEDNSIDRDESTEIDLSNDILINQMLADQGATINPDAEVFSVEEFIPLSENEGKSQNIVKPIKLSSHYEPIKK